MAFVRCSQQRQAEIRNRVHKNFGIVGLEMFERRLAHWLKRNFSPVRHRELLDIESMVEFEMRTLPERRELDRELRAAAKRFNELIEAREQKDKQQKKRRARSEISKKLG